MKRLLLLNGPNLDMLGTREPSVYGYATLNDLEQEVIDYGKAHGIEVECFQSNSEGDLVDKIHAAAGQFEGMVYNPGAHTHYSYALRDAVGGSSVPCVEVHISDVDTREAFRKISVVAPVCVAQVKGRGFKGYCDAIDLLISGASERLGEGYERCYPAGQVIVGGVDKIEKPTGEGDLFLEVAPQPKAASRRVSRVREALQERGMDAFFVRDTSSIAWLTAFDNVFDEEDAHALMVTQTQALLHTDSRYREAALCAAASDDVLTVDSERKTHAEFAKVVLEKSLDMPVLQEKIASKTPCICGIEDSVSLAQYRSLATQIDQNRWRIEETAGFMLDIRAIKEPSEIARMKAAQAITDAAFSHIVSFVKQGMTEREVQIELEDFMRRRGSEGLAFSSIVATGAHAASPHAIPGETCLEAGQCVVLDFGARFGGYCSDMTRMIFLGEPSERIKSAYETIRYANEVVERLLKPGVTGRQAHERAEEILAQRGFAATMGHGLGHGVGIDIHENPSLSPKNDQPLVAGNVITVEPGIYLPGEFGMRLEDFGVVTHDGFEVFTQSTHEMVII